MVHDFPREVALSYCTHCGVVRTAKHVNQAFLRNLLHRAETEGSIVIVDSGGKPIAVVSAPREELKRDV